MRAVLVALAVLAAACSSPGSDAGNSQAVEAQEDGAPRLARTLGEAGVPRIEDIPRLSGPVFDAAAPAAPAEASSSGDDELELPEAEAAVDLLPGDDVEELTSSTTDVANDDATESSFTTAPEETDAATTEDPEAAPTTAAPTTQAPATTTPPAPDPNDCEQVPENCVEPGQDFSSLDLNSSVFFESDLSGIDFSNSNLADADFSDSRAIAANFTGATMTDSVIVGADMTGADFTDADMTDAFIANSVFARAIWSNTTCPDGTNSNDLGGSCESAFG